jgi:hypothetical protein
MGANRHTARAVASGMPELVHLFSCDFVGKLARGHKISPKLKTPEGQAAVLRGWEEQIANGTLKSKGLMIDPARPHQGPVEVFEGNGYTLIRSTDGELRSVQKSDYAMAQRLVPFQPPPTLPPAGESK